jgi:hypothetical protein
MNEGGPYLACCRCAWKQQHLGRSILGVDAVLQPIIHFRRTQATRGVTELAFLQPIKEQFVLARCLNQTRTPQMGVQIGLCATSSECGLRRRASGKRQANLARLRHGIDANCVERSCLTRTWRQFLCRSFMQQKVVVCRCRHALTEGTGANGYAAVRS